MTIPISNMASRISSARTRSGIASCNGSSSGSMREGTRLIPQSQRPALPRVGGAGQPAVLAGDRIGRAHGFAHDDLVPHRLEQADRIGGNSALDAQFIRLPLIVNARRVLRLRNVETVV